MRAALLLLALLTVNLTAHEGHDHGPAPGDTDAAAHPSGPIVLTSAAIANLSITSEEAAIVPMTRSLEMTGRIVELPERHASVTSLFPGRVLETLVRLGQSVEAGQPLLRIEPLNIGSPPVTLKAPFPGLVIRQNLAVGQSFTTETTLLEIADYTQVLAAGFAYESPDLPAIQVGQNVRVILDSFPGRVLTGPVQRLDTGLDESTRTFGVYALLDNPGLTLRPNMSARLAVSLAPARETLAIPRRAILGDLGRNFVFVRDGNTFERRETTLGDRSGDLIEIIEGVLPGEQIVTQGQYQLQYIPPAPAASHPAPVESHPPPSVPQAPSWIWAIGGTAFGAILVGMFRPARN